MMKGFATKALHGASMKKDVHGALRMPVYDNVAFAFDDSLQLQRAFEGRAPSHVYSRITNPTIEDLEQRIRIVSGALGVIAVSSGMAAISNVILGLARAGSNVITTRYLFGNTASLFEKTMNRWGLETRFVDMTDPGAIEGAVDGNTSAIFFEVITNPQLEVADAAQVGDIGKRHGIPVVVDGTATTPYLFSAKGFGVDIEVISSTKYISGGGTSVGGLIIDYGTFDWERSAGFADYALKVGPFAFLHRLRREVYRNLGSCLSPHNAYLQTLGLETLGLRIDRSCASALEIARFLDRAPGVKAVNYPGLEASRYHAVARRQFGDRFGGILTFQLGSREECFHFMDRLEIVRRATNINDNRTLILHPASTIFCEYSAEDRQRMNVPDTMLRLCVGLEDVEDIIDDLAGGLA